MTVFFTSDHHFGHQNIIDFCERPFESVEHMNEMMVLWWNETVGPDDTVYYLGDFAMGRIADNLPIVGRLNGTKILYPGNHDRCWKGDTAGEKLARWTGEYLDAGFAEIRDDGWYDPEGSIWLSHFNFWVSHFPYHGESVGGREDRYSGMRPDDNGQYLLHGHVHDAWQQRGRMINVGVDVWDYRPVALDTILRLWSPNALLASILEHDPEYLTRERTDEDAR